MPKTSRSNPTPRRRRTTKRNSKRTSLLSQFGFVSLRKPLRWRNPAVVGFAALAVIVGIVAVSFSRADTSPGAGTASTTACTQAKGPFSTSGASVFTGNGQRFIPYGITIPGLAHSNYTDFSADDAGQINAAATGWCSNTVRLQVSQDTLVSSTGVVNQTFLNALETEVNQAKSLGLLVVINAQTEDVGLEPNPTTTTNYFWKTVDMVYGNDPQVAYDLFNEPRLGTGNNATDWKIWQNGGSYQGVTYIGMQQVANAIRAGGYKNLIWVEGPHTSTNLNLVSSYPINGVGPRMYAIHHPAGSHNAGTWAADFGYLVTNNSAPVVEGEWSNYASGTKDECWSDLPTAGPAFLSYLQSLKIGMTVWTLRQGVMIESSNYNDPTVIGKNWACVDNINGVNGANEGAGAIVKAWYAKQNIPPSPSPTKTPTPTPVPTHTPTPTP